MKNVVLECVTQHGHTTCALTGHGTFLVLACVFALMIIIGYCAIIMGK